MNVPQETRSQAPGGSHGGERHGRSCCFQTGAVGVDRSVLPCEQVVSELLALCLPPLAVNGTMP